MIMMKLKKQKSKKLSHRTKKLWKNKNCLKTNQLEKEINFLEMNKLVVDSLRENYK